MAASVAVCPLYAWVLVDELPWVADDRDGFWVQGRTYAFYLLGLLIEIVGTVVLPLVGALLLQRTRGGAFSFTIASLGSFIVAYVIVQILIALNIASGFSTPSEWGSASTWVFAPLRATTDLAAVGLAARLYAYARRPVPDLRDTHAFAVLTGVVLVAATASAVSEALWFSNFSGSVVILCYVAIANFVGSVLRFVGPAFLYGWIAISVLRRFGRDKSLAWSAVAGAVAASPYWLVIYAVPIWLGHAHAGIEGFAAALMDYVGELFMTLALGAGAGFIYGIAHRPLDETLSAAREYVLALPATLARVRNRPFVPTEDEER